jgi:hypothetical protein
LIDEAVCTAPVAALFGLELWNKYAKLRPATNEKISAYTLGIL